MDTWQKSHQSAMSIWEVSKILSIPQNPCVIEYSIKFHCFIIGTYELIAATDPSRNRLTEQEWSQINNRIGSLVIVDGENNLIHLHHCRQGGVFDLIISRHRFIDRFKNRKDDYQTILAAHSNGFIGVYRFNGTRIDNPIKLLNTECEMLTSVSDYSDHHNLSWTILSGCSQGHIHCFQLENSFGIDAEENEFIDDYSNQTNKPDYSKHLISVANDPIWYLRLFAFPSSQKYCQNETIGTNKEPNSMFSLLFVCSEDCRWRIFDANDQNEFVEIYANSDCKYGSTSIELYRQKQLEENLHSMLILIGSYDEQIRLYGLKIQNKIGDEEENVDSLKRILSCILLKTIHIPQSGIWRMKTFENYVLIAAMFSGVFLIEFQFSSLNFVDVNFRIDYELRNLFIDNRDSIALSKSNDSLTQQKHLIYGVAADENFTRIMVSSFYRKENFLLIQRHNNTFSNVD
ncbi:hypothetical protein NH340_JMT03971 [Sarcoptes scabiei]|nr:hypothetical protein NH340_JMT03971 [Sarcoptes scabiei]